jgi:hypothetical protein
MTQEPFDPSRSLQWVARPSITRAMSMATASDLCLIRRRGAASLGCCPDGELTGADHSYRRSPASRLYLSAPEWIGITASLGTMSILLSIASAGYKCRNSAKSSNTALATA